jgi:hypothetical protein
MRSLHLSTGENNSAFCSPLSIPGRFSILSRGTNLPYPIPGLVREIVLRKLVLAFVGPQRKVGTQRVVSGAAAKKHRLGFVNHPDVVLTNLDR